MFLTAFAEDTVLQRKAIRVPLAYSYAENDGSESPAEVKTWLYTDSVRATLFPTSAHQAAEQLQTRIAQATPESTVVTLYRPESDYRLEYTFVRQAAPPCWLLVHYADYTL